MPGPDAPYHHEASNDWKDYGQLPVLGAVRPDAEQYTALDIGHQVPPTAAGPTAPATCGPTSAAGYQAAVYGTPVSIATFGDDGLTPDLHAGGGQHARPRPSSRSRCRSTSPTPTSAATSSARPAAT